MTVVLDSSAILALLWHEKGHDVVATYLSGALVSTVNLAEVYGKCQDKGMDMDLVRTLVTSLQLTRVGYDEEQSFMTGKLRAQTAQAGLSLGDRACLSLALVRGVAAVTADKAWRSLTLPIQIIAIR